MEHLLNQTFQFLHSESTKFFGSCYCLEIKRNPITLTKIYFIEGFECIHVFDVLLMLYKSSSCLRNLRQVWR
jgi:hypothetical protein